MKSIYKVMMFFLIFYMTVVIIDVSEVFPNDSTFYSDADIQSLKDADSPTDAFVWIFTPNSFSYEIGGTTYNEVTIWLVLAVFGLVGTAAALFTKSFLPAVFTLYGLIFIPMFTKSYGFFNKLFQIGRTDDSLSTLVYLAITFGLALMGLILITMMEMPAHGRS